jgi:mycobactin peptide synthetase MbtF
VLALGGENIDKRRLAGIRAVCERTGMRAHNCYGPSETRWSRRPASPYNRSRGIGEPTAPTTA